MISMTIHTPVHAQDTMDYSIPIEIKGSLAEACPILFDINHYPTWNTVLQLSGNKNFKTGKKFKVKFKDQKGKTRTFKAKLIRKGAHSFVAQQNIFFGLVLSVTHHFVLEEINTETVKFTQHFELSGWLGNLMRKQILESLVNFEQMNEDFKNYIEKNY